MSDEEPDYLSDEFLAQCLPKEDVRPGLLHKRADKRKHELLKQVEKDKEEHRKKNKSIKLIEAERREEGLKTAIGSENKGFQMLQRMGFKPGMVIGLPKTASAECPGTSTRLNEPIPVVIKSDRKGLGEKTKMEEKRAKVEEWRKIRDQMSDPNKYRHRMIEGSLQKEIQQDLRKSQTVCRNLDLEHSKTEPDHLWFWPHVPKLNEEGEEEEEEEKQDEDEDKEPKEKLEIITEYLRGKYYYCIWCGTSYDDVRDLETTCPGKNRQEH